MNWFTLDSRLYYSGVPVEDLATESERYQLCQKGAATTWGINP